MASVQAKREMVPLPTGTDSPGMRPSQLGEEDLVGGKAGGGRESLGRDREAREGVTT